MLKFTKQPFSLQGKVLLINAISPGYVPTFALDRLIVLNGFNRVAFLQSDYLEPSVGYLPSDIEQGALGLPAQLYVNGDVCILQFRSALKFGRKKALAKQIANFVNFYKFEDVAVIGSLPYSIKDDREIGASHKNIYYKSKGIHKGSIKINKCAQLGYAEAVQVLKDQDEQQEIILNHGGLCGALVKQLENVVVLMMFNEQAEDRETGVYFSQQLYKFIDRKQISKIK